MLKSLLRIIRKRLEDEPDELELEESEPELEHGYISTDISRDTVTFNAYRHIEKSREDFSEYFCPECGRLLMFADKEASGLVVLRCYKCKDNLAVELEDKRRKIGFGS